MSRANALRRWLLLYFATSGRHHVLSVVWADDELVALGRTCPEPRVGVLCEAK